MLCLLTGRTSMCVVVRDLMPCTAAAAAAAAAALPALPPLPLPCAAVGALLLLQELLRIPGGRKELDGWPQYRGRLRLDTMGRCQVRFTRAHGGGATLQHAEVPVSRLLVWQTALASTGYQTGGDVGRQYIAV